MSRCNINSLIVKQHSNIERVERQNLWQPFCFMVRRVLTGWWHTKYFVYGYCFIIILLIILRSYAWRQLFSNIMDIVDYVNKLRRRLLDNDEYVNAAHDMLSFWRINFEWIQNLDSRKFWWNTYVFLCFGGYVNDQIR